MGARQSAGFTVIEAVLFLAVTGMLIAVMMVGSSTSINLQRYNDAVTTFKDDLQREYSELTSVRNDRAAAVTCDASGTSATTDRGQSNCIIVGRYLRITGSQIVSDVVVAYDNPARPVNIKSDFLKMKEDYPYNVVPSLRETKSMEWGTSIAWPRNVSSVINPRQLGILFISSPNSGYAYTFTSDTVPDSASINSTTFTNMMVNNNTTVPGRKAQVICIESNGLFVSDNRSIVIGRDAGSAGAIESRTNDLNSSDPDIRTSSGQPPQC